MFKCRQKCIFKKCTVDRDGEGPCVGKSPVALAGNNVDSRSVSPNEGFRLTTACLFYYFLPKRIQYASQRFVILGFRGCYF